MDCAGRSGEGTGARHHAGADRRDEGAPGRHQLRRRRGAGKGRAPRRDVPRLRLRRPVPQGGTHHPSGRHLLLCRRQYRRHRHAGGPAPSARQAGQYRPDSVAVRRAVPEPADAGVHPLSAGAAHHGRQARGPLDSGPFDGPGGFGIRAFRHEATGLQRDDRHAGELSGAVRRRP